MSRNLSTEQSSIRNADEFSSKFTVLHQAAVGVVLSRTREPFRAIETLRQFAFANRLSFKVWTITKGWAEHNRSQPDADPACDGVIDPISAMRKLGETAADEAGIYVMMYPHKIIPTNLVMIQLIKEYAKTFSEMRKRLVLVTPFGFELPVELQDDITILDFDPPSYAELSESYGRVVRPIRESKRPTFAGDDLDQILSAGAGMTAHEFENSLSRALVMTRDELPSVDVGKFSKIIMTVKTEVVKRSEVLEIMPATDIRNIGGLENLKSWIKKRSKCFSQEARDYGVEPPKGIALIGPPGTGKSASAKAIASELGLLLIKFDVGRVFNSLVGQSESRVREALKLVEAMAPCVLMIDEADKAFAGQANGGGGGDSGVGMRVLGAILTWMQETKAPVFMVVTANRVSGLPSEFLRRGRLDEIFSVTTPHEGEREEVLKIHLRIRGQNPDTITGLDAAVTKSAGYVSAEIESAVKDAIIEAYTSGQPLTGTLIGEQLEHMMPISEAFKEQFNEMKEWAENNARPASLPFGQKTETGIRQRPARNSPIRPAAGRHISGVTDLDG